MVKSRPNKGEQNIHLSSNFYSFSVRYLKWGLFGKSTIRAIWWCHPFPHNWTTTEVIGQTSLIQLLPKPRQCIKILVHGITLPYLTIIMSSWVPLCRSHTGLFNEPTLSLISQKLTELWPLQGQNPTCCHIQPYHGIITHNHEYEVSNRQRSMFFFQ